MKRSPGRKSPPPRVGRPRTRFAEPNPAAPFDFRSIVLARMDALGWSTADLARALEGRVPRNSLYRWVGGESDNLAHGSLAFVLDVLDIDVRVGRSRPKPPAKGDARG